jgi:hypothetical protein
MDEFTIGETDFGIEPGQSRLDLASQADGTVLLTLEVQGNQAVFDQLNAGGNSEWSWALYPPQFYLRQYPLPGQPKKKTVTVELQPEDADNYDVALYLMEHNPVEDVRITIKKGAQVEVTGQVELLGDLKDFRIRWSR